MRAKKKQPTCWRPGRSERLWRSIRTCWRKSDSGASMISCFIARYCSIRVSDIWRWMSLMILYPCVSEASRSLRILGIECSVLRKLPKIPRRNSPILRSGSWPEEEMPISNKASFIMPWLIFKRPCVLTLTIHSLKTIFKNFVYKLTPDFYNSYFLRFIW